METKEAILSLHIYLGKNPKRYLYGLCRSKIKTFNKVEWKKLSEILKKAGMRFRDRRIIRDLYKQEVAVIRQGTANKEANIRQGVRQGCSLSPVLFD